MKGSTGSRGFSLTEVVLALGVAAVAFTSLIGLFPTGLQMSKETYEETQAAFLAQTILNDLRDGLGGNNNGRFVQAGTNLGPTAYRLVQTNRDIAPTNANNYGFVQIAGTAAPQVLYIGYSNVTVTNTNEMRSQGALMLRPVLGEYRQTTNISSAASWYLNGSNGLAAVARVVVLPAFYLQSANGNTRMAEVSVETPGAARLTNRSQYLFVGGFN